MSTAATKSKASAVGSSSIRQQPCVSQVEQRHAAPCVQQQQQQHCRAAAAASVQTPATAAAPDKPSNCTYNAAVAWQLVQDARAAAAQNRRERTATFVLPAGGPGEDGAADERMPQGKGRPGCADAALRQQQVLAVAAARLQQEAEARVAEEVACMRLQAARISAGAQRAKAAKQQQQAQKQRLAADLEQQMQDKAHARQQALAARWPEHEQALLVSSKPSAAAAQELKRKQQVEYRGILDAQNAAKGVGVLRGPDQTVVQELQQQRRRLVCAALGDTKSA